MGILSTCGCPANPPQHVDTLYPTESQNPPRDTANNQKLLEKSFFIP
ncbi:hypothetical protein FHR95_003275 [Halomonas fontilapidosi]|uniref:Uncharacterized protein n=1 Tax=Halomonas fontilapidosi TaxID=616675 RepID=A0A7W5DML0_9GAMM|nr:hypothetical protein [Halomonas fontilapidosi]